MSREAAGLGSNLNIHTQVKFEHSYLATTAAAGIGSNLNIHTQPPCKKIWLGQAVRFGLLFMSDVHHRNAYSSVCRFQYNIMSLRKKSVTCLKILIYYDKNISC